jgi:hypothetical protein
MVKSQIENEWNEGAWNEIAWATKSAGNEVI